MTARGVRDNNPGNIRPGPQKWVGEIGNDAGYCIFDTPENGVRAMAKNLLTYQSKRAIRTIRGIITRYAPAADDNDTESYISCVAGDVGIGADADIELSNASVLSSLLMAICRHENGEIPYSVLVFERAASRAVGDGLDW